MQRELSVDEQNKDCGYISFWKKKETPVQELPKFTEMQLALMEGGHSLEEKKVEKFSFLKSLEQNTLP